MPTPKKKSSRMRKGHRRSHDALKTPAMAFDPQWREWVRPHRAFKAADGAWYYKGRQILPPKSKEVEGSTAGDSR